MRLSLRKLGAGGVLAVTLMTATMPHASAQSATPARWESLFDGTTMSQWRGYKMTTIPSGWQVSDGTIYKASTADDLISRNKYANFELELEWKIAPGGNAGIFYRGSEEFERIYWTGPEYQILDDGSAPDGKNRLTSAGAAYALYAAPAGIVKPAGEWNATRIVVDGAHVEHWMNGKKLLEYKLWSPEWEAKVKATKFAAWPRYGREKVGHVGIQGDHTGALALRNLRIKVLP